MFQEKIRLRLEKLRLDFAKVSNKKSEEEILLTLFCMEKFIWDDVVNIEIFNFSKFGQNQASWRRLLMLNGEENPCFWITEIRTGSAFLACSASWRRCWFFSTCWKIRRRLVWTRFFTRWRRSCGLWSDFIWSFIQALYLKRRLQSLHLSGRAAGLAVYIFVLFLDIIYWKTSIAVKQNDWKIWSAVIL